jgi:homoserine dehydrogenase
MDIKTVKVGIVGFGTIGSGVAKILIEDADRIAARTGVRLELAQVVDINTTSRRAVILPDGILTDDINMLLNDKSISIGVELVGGITAAKEIHLNMLAAGKDVVTANKALLAEHGWEIFHSAREKGRCVAFEASCAGGIPIISALRTGLIANEIEAMYGIVNGTCNYILTNMAVNDMEFSDALAQAQEKGFAEADQTLDISGGDSAHKLAILASIAFGCEIGLEDIYVEGIESISKDDIRCGGEMGYCLKLLAIGHRDNNKISLRVHPSFINKECSLARVNGSFNAISIFGDSVGEVILYGRGAGMMPTASAIVADIIEVALGNSGRTFLSQSLKSRKDTVSVIASMDELVSRFYIRLMAKDKPGVVATYGKVLGDHNISISGALQHEGAGPDNSVPVIITTHETQERNMSAALDELSKLDIISAKPVCIRIVDIPEDTDN